MNVVDVNDNKPHFISPNAKFNGKYFGAIPVDSQIGTVVLQVKVSHFIKTYKFFFSKNCHKILNVFSFLIYFFLLEKKGKIQSCLLVFLHL